MELDEARKYNFDNICQSQARTKEGFDKATRNKSLQIGDMVLLWDCMNEKPKNHENLDSLWLGPYIIIGIIGANSFYLNTLEGDPVDLPVNGQMLKLYNIDDI